ncbi:MAG: IucA/IucC family protein [Pseudomonadota bacterium]|nr:IucA/IucC family protein [Pseudomonadota bacterium]
MVRPDAHRGTAIPGIGWGDEAPERRVLRQLLEACVFEGLLPWRAGPMGRSGWRPLTLTIGDRSLLCQGRIRGFDRVRLRPDSLPAYLATGESLARIVRALTPCRQRGEHLLRLLNATVENTLRLSQALHSSGATADRRALSGDALDAALTEGHPYHPCFKSRFGFRAADLLRYSPETGQGFHLLWLAVPFPCLNQSYAGHEGHFLEQALGTDTRYLLRAACFRAGLDPHQYGLMPVHPWQWQQLNHSPAAGTLSAAGVHVLGTSGDRYRPGQSLRSLFPADQAQRATIKLPLGVINTSSRRHLEPHSILSAPAISAWLQQTVNADSRFGDRFPLRLLSEYGSVAWHPVVPEDPAGAMLTRELGAIWRRPMSDSLSDGETAIPMNALYAVEADGQPFVQPWIERYGLNTWLEAALNTLVLPVWHLLVAHGIGVEAHGQNSLLVVRDGWPVALMLRDFHDSVEYVDDFLPPAAPRPDFGPRQALYDQAPDDRYYRMGKPEALRELAMDTLFVFNLSELALMLSSHYQLPEPTFWQRVIRILTRYAEQYPSLAARVQALGAFRPSITTESLLTRLVANPQTDHRHTVANALAAGSDTPNETTYCQGESGV